LDILFQSQKFFRQTDGLRLVISNAAILDDDLNLHGLLSLPFRFDCSPDRQCAPDWLPIEYSNRSPPFATIQGSRGPGQWIAIPRAILRENGMQFRLGGKIGAAADVLYY
jgi:hypothetical protein